MHSKGKTISGRFFRFSRHILFESNSMAHIFHHDFVNGHILTGNPSTKQALLDSIKGLFDFEQRIISMCALWLPSLVVSEMHVSANEGKRIQCHDIV